MWNNQHPPSDRSPWESGRKELAAVQPRCFIDGAHFGLFAEKAPTRSNSSSKSAMPKFPGLSGADIVRALEKLGFVVARQSGSHILMKRDNQGCVIPNHKEVKIGTVNGILRQAGVRAQDFSKVL